MKQTTAKPATAMFATRAFKDTGTGRSFDKGAEVKAKEGELANYAAAGLVSDEQPEAPAADAAA